MHIDNKHQKSKYVKEFLYITLGCFLTALSYSVFLVPYDLVTGGVGGLSIVLVNIFPNFPISPAIIVLGINTILIILSFIFLGPKFTARTIYGSLIFPIFSEIIARVAGDAILQLPTVLDDLFLVTLFSSIIMGAGIGLVFRYGGSTGGSEIPQYMLLKYAKMPLSTSLIIIDGAVIALGPTVGLITGETVIALNKILYGILAVFISGYFIDNIVFGGFNVRSAYIISSKAEEIKQHILEVLNRGVTEIYTRGAYSKKDNMMLLCVLSTREYYYLRSIINETDPKAFVFVARAHEVRGEGFTYEVPDND
jgi:uncharacterized membrane-anchored protein YitT (DUF2179 family)